MAAANEPVFGLVDEASKLNLNTASQSMLEGLPGMTAELAAAIIDWRDEDDEVTSGGAETETYQFRRPAYACKNAPFETVEELALVNGATREVLFGEDANRNGILDLNENDGDASYPPDDSDGRLDPGILDFVTVYSREPNTRSDGSARINVTSGGQELQSLLTETFGEQRASEIQGRLSGAGTVRSMMEWFIRSGMTADEMDQLGGELTVTNGDFVVGLVNVNTASEQVLACVPGIDESQASALVAARAGRAAPAASVGWAAEVLGEESAVQAGPYLTAQSWQVSADIAALGRHARGYRRALMVIDAAGESPVLVYRRNLSSLGWALGERVVQSLDPTARRSVVSNR
jgi:type II secretory pathway component PulK